jgi:hypothetical protein
MGSMSQSPLKSDCSSTTPIDEYPTFPKRSSPIGVATRRTSGYDLEKTIPPTNDHRTLVLCFDGTGNQFDDEVRTIADPLSRISLIVSKNSNVINFFTLLKKDDKSQQLVYYQVRTSHSTLPILILRRLGSVPIQSQRSRIRS